MRYAVLLLVVVVVAAGCGGRSAPRVVQHARQAKPNPCDTPASARARAKLRADIAALRRAANLETHDTLKGNAAVNRATDRFLLDVAQAPIPLVEQNEFINHAAAALVGSCEQCFQALEAARPIPAIAHGGRCASA